MPTDLNRRRETSTSRLSAGIATVVTVLAGTAAPFVATAPAAAIEATQVAPPTVRLTMNHQGEIRTRDAFNFRPGLIRFSISGDSNCPVWFIRLHDGYKEGYAKLLVKKYSPIAVPKEERNVLSGLR